MNSLPESSRPVTATRLSSVAKKAGYEQISEIFTDTANNEKEHAKLFTSIIVD